MLSKGHLTAFANDPNLGTQGKAGFGIGNVGAELIGALSRGRAWHQLGRAVLPRRGMTLTLAAPWHSFDPRCGSNEWCRLRDSNTRPRHYEAIEYGVPTIP